MSCPIENVQQFYIFHHHCKENGLDQLRLGQRFWNMYLKKADNSAALHSLYEAGDKTAQGMIEQWLLDNSYHGTMPEPLKGAPHGKCNRTACQKLFADWYNPGTHAYYCRQCAHDINRACEGDSCWEMIVKVY